MQAGQINDLQGMLNEGKLRLTVPKRVDFDKEHLRKTLV